MRTDLKEPCSACPFRKKALPGWLGPWEPRHLAMSLQHNPFPCHKTIQGENIQFDDPRYAKMQSCAGAAIQLANDCTRPEVPEMIEHQKQLKALPNYSELSQSVFARKHDFIEFHQSAKVKSWSM